MRIIDEMQCHTWAKQSWAEVFKPSQSQTWTQITSLKANPCPIPLAKTFDALV